MTETSVLLVFPGDPSQLPVCPVEETRKLSREKSKITGSSWRAGEWDSSSANENGKEERLGWGRERGEWTEKCEHSLEDGRSNNIGRRNERAGWKQTEFVGGVSGLS